MVSLPELTKLALALPEVESGGDETRVAFAVAGKGLAWTYLVRDAPKKPRRPRLDVLAVRCSLEAKELLIEAAPDRFFDDDHYRGYPAVLVRLEEVEADELAGLLKTAWALTAPRRLVDKNG